MQNRANHVAEHGATKSNVAVHIAHVVMQEHVGGARGVDAEGGADNATARHVDGSLFRLLLCL